MQAHTLNAPQAVLAAVQQQMGQPLAADGNGSPFLLQASVQSVRALVDQTSSAQNKLGALADYTGQFVQHSRTLNSAKGSKVCVRLRLVPVLSSDLVSAGSQCLGAECVRFDGRCAVSS